MQSAEISTRQYLQRRTQSRSPGICLWMVEGDPFSASIGTIDEKDYSDIKNLKLFWAESNLVVKSVISDYITFDGKWPRPDDRRKFKV